MHGFVDLQVAPSGQSALLTGRCPILCVSLCLCLCLFLFPCLFLCLCRLGCPRMACPPWPCLSATRSYTVTVA